MKQTKSIQAITLTALFAALTFIGTTIKNPLTHRSLCPSRQCYVTFGYFITWLL